MRHIQLIVLIVVSAALSAQGATVNFATTLNGANERPTPTNSTGSGRATAQLNGDAGSFVLTYQIEYSGLTGPAIGGHIHDAINPPPPPDLPFTEKFGPIIHHLDSLPSLIAGDWRFDDATDPLTDDKAAKLIAGAYYINIHTEAFQAGEIRGQLVQDDAGAIPIPLPAPFALGLMGLVTAGFTVWRQRRIRL